MRNEIFRQINQNKIQYYSELKNYKRKKIINPEISGQNEIKNEDTEQKDFHSSVLKKFSISRSKQLAGITLNARNQITDISERTKLWISNINHKLSNEADIQSNKLTDGLSRISSQLFEDKYEYQQHISMSSDKVELSNDPVQTLVVPHHLFDNNLTAQFLYWLNKLYCKIILFLESDDWFEKIERSQQTSQENKHHNQLKDRIVISYQKINKSLNSSGIFQYYTSIFKVKENSSITDKKGLGKEDGKFNSGFIKNHFKSLSNTIFPVINRFI